MGDAPYASAFDVWLERDGKRWKAGPVHFGAHKQHGHGSSARIDEFTPEKVDVILEPSLDAAVNSVDRMTIWGERIVIRDVPVKRQ